MRLKAILLSLAVFLSTAMAVHALPTPAINLDVAAQTLADGDLVTWYNAGTVTGKFDARGTPPVVETVEGKRAVTFSGNNGYRAEFVMPADFSGSMPFTVNMVVLNPGVQGTERIFGWTRLATADRQAAIFGYGSGASSGAANHWGTQNDMGYDRGVPTQGQWHTITIVYAGISGWERVYVDGVLNAIEKKPDNELNNAEYGGPVWLACTDDPNGDQNFSGSLASLKVYSAEATFAEVLSLNGMKVPGEREHPKVINGSFEAGVDWNPINPAGTFINNGDNRTIPGWASADIWIPGNAGREGIGVCGKNLAVAAGSGYWDNGQNADGNRVLALAGRDAEGSAISQWLTMRGGRSYHILIRANAKSGGSALMRVYFNNARVGSELVVNPVDVAGVFEREFYTWEANVTPPADGHYELKIEQANPGTQNVLLLDLVEVINTDPPVPILITPNPIDFGQVARTKTVERQIKVRNLSSRTLDLWQFSRLGSTSGLISLPDDPDPGTNSDNVANIRIEPYEAYTITVRLVADNTTGNRTGTFRIRWRNGPFAGDADTPWQAVVPTKPEIWNGGFENPRNPRTAWNVANYYNQLGDNLEIPYWTAPADGIGVGQRAAGFGGAAHPFINQGTLNEGIQALWIHNIAGHYAPLRGVRQMVAGWDKAKTYRLSVWANSRNTGGWTPARLVVKVNGTALTPENGADWASRGGGFALSATTATLGQTSGQFYNPQYAFTPPNVDNGMYLVEILGQDNGGDKILAVDNVQIFEVGANASTSMRQTPGAVSLTGTVGLNSNSGAIQVINNGGKVLNLSNLQLTGEMASNFAISGTPTLAVPAFGGRSTINVYMKATQVGGVGAALSFATDDGTTASVSVPVYGSAVNYPKVVNGSFEWPVAYWANDGTWRCHLHTIQGRGAAGPFGWDQSGNGNAFYGVAIPIDPEWQNLHWNNGAAVDGTQVGWIQTGTSNASGDLKVVHNWRQTVYGFYNGGEYTVRMWVNARNNNDGIVAWKLQYGRDFSNLRDLIELNDLTAVAAQGDFTVPFEKKEATFTASHGTGATNNVHPNGSVAFQIQVPNQIDDSTLLIDAFEVQGPPVNAIKGWGAFE